MSGARAGGVVWLTGVPASGKTTVARHVRDALRERDVAVVWLDSDDMRRAITPAPTYTREERDHFYAILGHVARLAADGGAVALVSATAPRRAHRDAVREAVPHFVEVWVRCDPDTARERDPKGLYALADRGEITTLPGAGATYEEPRAPELILDAASEPPTPLAARVMERVARAIPSAGPASRREAPARRSPPIDDGGAT
ncbi:MAG: adenylyl-sulfate kinase [Myxococcota bacterium]